MGVRRAVLVSSGGPSCGDRANPSKVLTFIVKQTETMSDPVDCFICIRHQQGNDAQGGILYEDDFVYVGHLPTMGRPSAYRGWLIVETKRHVADLGELDDDETASIGVTVNRVAHHP